MLLATNYWSEFGAPASVDWCEPNNTYGPYVAELWNTVSTLPLILLGLYGFWRCTQVEGGVARRFPLLFLALSIVGAGSSAFHGTMLQAAQALDELPMIYGSLIFLYCLTNRHDTRHARSWAWALTVYAGLFTAGYFWLTDYFTLFIWSYAGLATVLVLGAVRVARGPGATPTHRRLITWAAGLFVGGVFGLWIPEHILLDCDHPLQALHLHSGWHVAAGVGTYLGILFVMWDRMWLAGRSPTLQLGFPAPFVVPGPADEADSLHFMPEVDT